MNGTKYRENRGGAVLARAAVSALVIALWAGCGSEDDGGAAGTSAPAGTGGGSGMTSGGTGGGGMGGTGGGTAGTAGNSEVPCDVPIVQEPGGLCINTGEDNVECASADAPGPFTGVCAPKGSSCHRSSNRAKECLLGADEPIQLEYRVTASLPINMPRSTSQPIFNQSALGRARTCDSEQCLLLRTTQPRMGGERVAGEGLTEIAVGRYNCDGTYSFYGDTAAPERPDEGRTGANRWAVKPVTTSFDPSKEGRAASMVTGPNPNRHPSCNAFYVGGSSDVDWEICTMGFDLTVVDTSEEGMDGSGTFTNGMWDQPGRYIVYAPIALNNADVINALSVTFCQLLAFGPVKPEMAATLSCETTPRCMPDSEGCAWVKLPDSLCPSEAEAGTFGCHLGVKENINNEADYPTDVTCTMEAPTSPLGDSEGGQCCDPLGAGTNGLPACNSYRIVNSYSAAAAEITDDPRNDLQPVCQ